MARDRPWSTWSAATRAAATNGGPTPRSRCGIIALAIDEQGQIMHFTTAYDSSLFDDPTYQALVLLAAEQ
ncbi:MAG: hypothetical protein JO134_03400 [Xanthobacteraceae bacterium]|nr:hypothetical protein [Xanthobacteraceae bacterium]